MSKEIKLWNRIYIGGALWLLLALCLCSSFGIGCSGIELGGKLGMYRVDERQESQRTYRKATPLKCYFVNCADTQEAQGS